jgi:hypothetical protein
MLGQLRGAGRICSRPSRCHRIIRCGLLRMCS